MARAAKVPLVDPELVVICNSVSDVMKLQVSVERGATEFTNRRGEKFVRTTKRDIAPYPVFEKVR